MYKYKKNKIYLLSLVLAVSLYANDKQGIEIGNGWVTTGDIRMGYVNYDYNNPLPTTGTINKGHADSHGFYTTPKISILTPEYQNFSAKVTVGGATDFGINNPDYENRNFVYDSTDKKSFTILQEMYIKYETKIHNLIVGRYELETPLIEPDDYYMLANTYETISYTNSAVDNYQFHLGYISRMAGVWDSGSNGTEFHSMSDTSFVDQRDKANADNGGIIYGAVEYKNDTHKLKAWEYYIEELYNMFLAQYDFNNNFNGFSYNFALQFTDYKELGKLASNNYTNIDYSIYAIKFDGAFDNGVDFATGASKFSDGDGIGSTLSAWGGFPTYTYGLIYNWFETGSLRNSQLYKVQLGYDLAKLGLKNSWIGYRHTYYDLDAKYSKTASGLPQNSMRLNGVRFKYNTSNKGVYFIANYEHRVLSNEPDAFAYRLIGGYKF